MEQKRRFKRHVIVAVNAYKEDLDNSLINGDSIDESQEYGISRNVLQAAFKQLYGTGVRDYKLQLRMELSRLYLEEGKNVKQVSLELNYATHSGFTSAFKRYFGITPTQLINQHTFRKKRKVE